MRVEPAACRMSAGTSDGILREALLRMDVLVVDIGGTHVKMRASSATTSRQFDSHACLAPADFVALVLEETADWRYDVVSIGYPGAVGPEGPRLEPGNLGQGWVAFDFAAAFRKPVRIVNDAALQALGAYEGGRMLFLGLGTGLGSALVSDHVVVPMELGNLQIARRQTLGERLGGRGRDVLGHDRWERAVLHALEMLRHVFVADYVVLGGGHAAHVDTLPPHTRRGGNEDAFVGGFRLWEEQIEPHDRPSAAWRVVR